MIKACLLIITLSHNYSWRYLQSLRTDDIGVGGIKRKGIDLDKSTKPCKETEQTVCESHKICLLVGKAVGRFSSPTQINSRRFGNTKKPSFPALKRVWQLFEIMTPCSFFKFICRLSWTFSKPHDISVMEQCWLKIH